MKFKSLFVICFTFFLINAHAQKLSTLECVGKTKVGASSTKNFSPDLYNKVEDTELLIIIKNQVLTIGDTEIKKIETNLYTRVEDLKISGDLEIKDTYYDGYYTLNQGSEESQNYTYIKHKIFLNRLNGEFVYSYGFYIKNINENWLGKLAKTKLVNGYIDRIIEGKCKQITKKQLF